MRYENQGRINSRIKRRYIPNQRNGPKRVRGGDNTERPRRRMAGNNRGNQSGRGRIRGRLGRGNKGPHKKIRRDNNRKADNKEKDTDTLDKQMREYWAKSGSAKGKEDKNIASQKMNEQLDEYWKKAKKEEEEKKSKEEK